ncbi:MAG: hypothetical protein ACFFCY_09535 [Promethearchaeota archaeon]
MEPEKNNQNLSKKTILKLIGLAIYAAIFLYLYFLLINFGLNPLIISILLVFIFLTTIGPFLRPKKRRLYSRMFPNRKSGANLNKDSKKTHNLKQKELNQLEPRIPKPMNLDFEYRKSIINKCKNCGNTVPNFVKKCPFCNEVIIQ